MKIVEVIIHRRDFYKNVKFADRYARRYLKRQIYQHAVKYGLNSFEKITDYVTHVSKAIIEYPVVIYGSFIYQIEIEDCNGNIFKISLQDNKIVHSKESDNFIDFYIIDLLEEQEVKRYTQIRLAKIFCQF